jgi:hypothetical protein
VGDLAEGGLALTKTATLAAKTKEGWLNTSLF